MKERKKKTKRVSGKELSKLIYRLELKSKLGRIIKCILLVIVIPITWYLTFMYYPFSTMVDISGRITERNLFLTTGRFKSNPTRNYVIQLDDHTSPIRFQSLSKFPFLEQDSLGIKVTVQIQKKDLDKLRTFTLNKPLDQYTSSEMSNLPRMYGIRTDQEVIITSMDALWDAPTPFMLAYLCRWAGGLVIIISLYLIFYDIKCLYRLIKTKKVVEC